MNVLIATHGRPELLKQSLVSIISSRSIDEVTKIVVVENGGDYGSKSICSNLQKLYPIQFLAIKRPNKSLALNAGLKICDDGLVFMTDDDIILTSDILSHYIEASKNHKSGVYFGGPTKANYELEPPIWIKTKLPPSAAGYTPKEPDSKTNFFLGFNWAAYKGDLMKTNGFNPNFGPGSKTRATGQEAEMQRQLQNTGCYSLYLPRAIVTHEVPKERCSRDWLVERAFRQGVENGLILAERDPIDIKTSLRKKTIIGIRSSIGSCIAPTEIRRFNNSLTQQSNRGIKHGIAMVLEKQIALPPYL